MVSLDDIVDAIIEDLAGRRGLGDEWDMLDDDIKAEIRAKWLGILVEGLGW